MDRVLEAKPGVAESLGDTRLRWRCSPGSDVMRASVIQPTLTVGPHRVQFRLDLIRRRAARDHLSASRRQEALHPRRVGVHLRRWHTTGRTGFWQPTQKIRQAARRRRFVGGRAFERASCLPTRAAYRCPHRPEPVGLSLRRPRLRPRWKAACLAATSAVAPLVVEAHRVARAHCRVRHLQAPGQLRRGRRSRVRDPRCEHALCMC